MRGRNKICWSMSATSGCVKIASGNIKAAQALMKRWFNKEAKSREFKPGDKVLVLLPIPGSSLQARYCGPYLVQQTIGD